MTESFYMRLTYIYVVKSMEMKEQRDIEKKVEIDIVSKNIKIYYLVESYITINNIKGDIKFTITTEDAIDFNIVNDDIEFHKDAIVEMEQNTVIEHEKKIVQLTKNLKALTELGYDTLELS